MSISSSLSLSPQPAMYKVEIENLKNKEPWKIKQWNKKRRQNE